MAIPNLTRDAVWQALDALAPELNEINNGPHRSINYDLVWKSRKYPPKVVVSKAVELLYGYDYPESEFSGGEGSGHANPILRDLGFEITSKSDGVVALDLVLHQRYGRKEIYATQSIPYDQQKQHLNTGLSPRCPDDGYMVFVTLNKEQLDPTHDYADELFSDQLIWVSRRDVAAADQDYVNLTLPQTRVSVFVRNRTREDFAYLGEVRHSSPRAITDPTSGRSQLRFIWRLRHAVPDALLQQLNLGISSENGTGRRRLQTPRRSRIPSTFDEFRRAYSYAVGAVSDRTIVPEHHNYQVLLAKHLEKMQVPFEMERDFVDVSFTIDSANFIGEIKVTKNLTLAQAFRTALGQVIEYAHLLFDDVPKMVIFLDQELDAARLKIASRFEIAVVVLRGESFALQNPEICTDAFRRRFPAL